MIGMREQEVSRLDTKGVQRARNSDPSKAGDQPEGTEDEIREDMQLGLSDFRLQCEDELSG
jgi:hypothetical protein